MKTLRDYTKEVTFESLNNFVQYANDEGYAIEIKEGVLNDTYVIFNEGKKLSIKGVKARDYIILYPQFLTSWNNTFHILMTDNENKANNFLN